MLNRQSNLKQGSLLCLLQQGRICLAGTTDLALGFKDDMCGAQVALEGEADAAMQAIARTAKHRLERGIWTSPGAGLPCPALVNALQHTHVTLHMFTIHPTLFCLVTVLEFLNRVNQMMQRHCATLSAYHP